MVDPPPPTAVQLLGAVRICDLYMEREESFSLYERNGISQFLVPYNFPFIDLEGIGVYLSFLIFFNTTFTVLGEHQIKVIHQEEEIKRCCDLL